MKHCIGFRLHTSGLFGATIKTILLFIIFIFAILSGCKENPTAPKIENNPPGPGRRDYTWTVDTLITLEGYMGLYYMWGTAANDLWACGPAYRNTDCIWHYNGAKWEKTPVHHYIQACGIWGSGKNDVWIGSTDAAFWHYDGLSWSRFCEYKIDGYEYAMAQRMDGKSTDEIYGVGFAETESGQYKGIIMHFDGKIWEQVSIPDIMVIFAQINYNKETDQYLIMGIVRQTSESIVYLFDRKSLKEILRSTNTAYTLNKVGDKIYLNDSFQKIYRYDNSKFNLFKDFTGTSYAGRIWGRSEIDFFTDNRDGIGHYNGTDIITIFKEFSNEWTMNELIVFDNDVFSTWQDLITVSIHGKLK